MKKLQTAAKKQTGFNTVSDYIKNHKEEKTTPEEPGAICFDCGRKYGKVPDYAIGMWEGYCTICAEKKFCADAAHDFKVFEFPDNPKELIAPVSKKSMAEIAYISKATRLTQPSLRGGSGGNGKEQKRTIAGLKEEYFTKGYDKAYRDATVRFRNREEGLRNMILGEVIEHISGKQMNTSLKMKKDVGVKEAPYYWSGYNDGLEEAIWHVRNLFKKNE